MSGTRIRVRAVEGEREAYLSVPKERTAPGAAVIVIHEIWGLSDHICDVADRLAGEGYLALAPQLYTGELADAMAPAKVRDAIALLRRAPPEVQRDPGRMEELMPTLSGDEQLGLRALIRVMSADQRDIFARDLVAIVQQLRAHPKVDPKRVGSVGFCMGGSLSGRLATQDPDLRACVILYGEAPEPREIPSIRAPVLGLYGGDDPRITDTVPAFAEAMQRAGQSFAYHVYPGARHAFFNDSREATYDPMAAADAWRRMLRFFADHL